MGCKWICSECNKKPENNYASNYCASKSDLERLDELVKLGLMSQGEQVNTDGYYYHIT